MIFTKRMGVIEMIARVNIEMKGIIAVASGHTTFHIKHHPYKALSIQSNFPRERLSPHLPL